MIKGSCLCGGVRYEVTGPFRAMACCHCRECRKASGAEFATNATVNLADLQLSAGEELLGEFESSKGQARVFCRRCGSPIMKRFAARPDEVRLRLGCLDSNIDERALAHVFVGEKPNWSEIHDELPQFDTAPPSNG
jgi:hypothetical protein